MNKEKYVQLNIKLKQSDKDRLQKLANVNTNGSLTALILRLSTGEKINLNHIEAS